MTTAKQRPAYTQLRATLERLGNQVWQRASEAQLPKPVAQYFWVNIPGKISQAGLVLACITPGSQQAEAIREVSQRGDRDVLPILAFVEDNADFAMDVRQEARTARQRITAHLERKCRQQALLSTEMAEILDNFSGFVCAGIGETVAGNRSATAGGAGTGMRDHTIMVWLEPVQPAHVRSEPVMIGNGQDADEVLFDIFLDSDDATIKQQRFTLACRPGTASGRLQFSATADAGRGHLVYWVNVFQKNRLIQILEFTAVTASNGESG